MTAHHRPRLLAAVDRALAGLIILAVAGPALAFGGAVWWGAPALAVLTVGLLVAWLARALITGRLAVLKSPLTALGLMALGLAAFQLAPLPGRVSAMLSARARAAHALRTLPDLARADDPGAEIPEPGGDRSPLTLDRPATLRWMAGAAAGLALFCVCAGFADRFGHAAVIWGGVVAAFFVGTTFGVVQVATGVSGLYGAIRPGSGRPGMPTLDDVAGVPGERVLRPIGEGRPGAPGWSLPRPEAPFLLGTMPGGAGSYLALGALALPLSLGLTLQVLAPRGSRQGMRARLRESGKAGLFALMVVLTACGAGLVGYLAGPVLCAPFALGFALDGLPAASGKGLRWAAAGLTACMLGALGLGAWAGEAMGRPRGADALDAGGLRAAMTSWREAARVARDFPLVGAGLGAYPAIVPYYKDRDATPNTAGSTVLQWWAEAGLAGMALLAAGGLWALARLPGAARRVGSADRALASMLVGTGVCFGLFAAMHWSVELAAVGLAACAVGGTANRWLAGGTDLFVEPA